ncbi:RebB family R body protein [Nisaea sp.]|uniref:RebB family R body protein n=1 Tax=Nisaea sp. TaxID=2024842 RepID=UPI0032F02A3D
MADQVNGQITDAVTQANVKVIGEAPAEAVGMSFQAFSHATGLAMENATSTQGGMQQVANAATSSICALIVELASQ